MGWFGEKVMWREPVAALLKSLQEGEWEYVEEPSPCEMHVVVHKTTKLTMAIGRNGKYDPWIFNESWMNYKERQAVVDMILIVAEVHKSFKDANERQQRESEFFKLLELKEK